MQHIIHHKDFSPNNIIYGFVGKHPDISVHKYRDHDYAAKNRDMILKFLGNNHSSMSLLKQVHGINCIELKRHEDIDYNHEGDAQITTDRNIILAVNTADCTPVLLMDQREGIVAAVHAGWRGALDGIINSTLNAMQKAGANKNNIVAVIGPCIRQKSYEVSGDFINNFLLEDINNSRFFKSNVKVKGKYFFDLPGYVKDLLIKSYIKKIYDIGIDTCAHPDFFSYREACLAQKKLDGSNLSFIGLK